MSFGTLQPRTVALRSKSKCTRNGGIEHLKHGKSYKRNDVGKDLLMGDTTIATCVGYYDCSECDIW
jgi:hypothetical protein